MRTILTALAVNGAFAIGAYAVSVPPCTAGAAGENLLPVQSSQITYCISDFGWSDTWLMGNPAAYSQPLDVLSGDDAFNLNYVALGGHGSGLGWLTPSLDGGTLSPHPVPSVWSVITPVHYTGPSSAESTIGDADGLQITFDTTAIGLGAQISLTITNTSPLTLTGLQLADYFNFHPNGSVAPNNDLGTTSIQDLGTASGKCVVTTGVVASPSFLMNGFLCGSRPPTNYDLGSTTVSPTVESDVQNIFYNNVMGPLGPGDYAAALEWDLGNLGPGQTIVFAVGKSLDPVIIPEPVSVSLLAGALALFAGWRRLCRS